MVHASFEFLILNPFSLSDLSEKVYVRLLGGVVLGVDVIVALLCVVVLVFLGP